MTCYTYNEYKNYLTENITGWHLEQTNCHTLLASYYQKNLYRTMQVDTFDSGIVLSRLNGRGHASYNSSVKDFEHNFSLFVMLSGRNNFVLNKQAVSVNPNELWLVKGHWQDIEETIDSTNGQLEAIHIDFSLQRLQRWQEDGILNSGLFAKQFSNSAINQSIFTESTNNLVCQLSKNILPIKNMAKKILQYPYQLGSLNHIELESASLDLTAKLLHFCLNHSSINNQRQRSQVDEAVDIIYQEFNQPLTISGLAKRVGMNECYLKKHFKTQTGETIAQFIRKLRMQQALEMLTEHNKSIKETMFFVGYQHAGHFNDIFKRHYGFLPRDAKLKY